MNVNQLYNGNELSDNDKADLNDIADKIKDGKVILFLGAAVHCPPPEGFEELYPEDNRPPLGKQLADKLAGRFTQAIRDKHYSLSWMAQYYEIKQSRPELIKKVSEELQKAKPSPLLYALAEMDFRYIITTNYDNLYEEALTKAKKENFKKGIYKPNQNMGNRKPILPETTTDFPIQSITSREPFIYKIHGDIKETYDLGREHKYDPARDAIVLTDEDYIHFILRMGEKESVNPNNNFNPIPYSFMKALADPDDITILFIGYSLMDYNLRLLFKSAMWNKDIGSQLRKWSVDLYPDPTVKTICQQHYTISFIENDAWRVIPFLYAQIFNKEMPV